MLNTSELFENYELLSVKLNKVFILLPLTFIYMGLFSKNNNNELYTRLFHQDKKVANAAFEEVVILLENKLYQHIYKYFKDKKTTLDCVVEVFSELQEAIENQFVFEGDNIEAYLLAEAEEKAIYATAVFSSIEKEMALKLQSENEMIQNAGITYFQKETNSEVLKRIQRFVSNNEEAKDIRSKVFEQFIKNTRKQKLIKGNPKLFLYKMAWRMAKDVNKSKKRHEELNKRGFNRIFLSENTYVSRTNESMYEMAIEEDIHKMLANKEKKTLLEKLLSLLPNRCEEHIRWFYYEGLSQKEMAEIRTLLDNKICNEGTIKTKLAECKEALRKKFQEWNINPSSLF